MTYYGTGDYSSDRYTLFALLDYMWDATFAEISRSTDADAALKLRLDQIEGSIRLLQSVDDFLIEAVANIGLKQPEIQANIAYLMSHDAFVVLPTIFTSIAQLQQQVSALQNAQQSSGTSSSSLLSILTSPITWFVSNIAEYIAREFIAGMTSED